MLDTRASFWELKKPVRNSYLLHFVVIGKLFNFERDNYNHIIVLCVCAREEGSWFGNNKVQKAGRKLIKFFGKKAAGAAK